MDDFAGAAADLREALAVLDPAVSPKLYRVVLANLANALQRSGKRSDLLLADQYIRKARHLFQGVTKCSQERAKLDWITAMVRHQLGHRKSDRIRKMLVRALNDFLTLGMPLEAVAILADMARMCWHRYDYHARIRGMMAKLSGRLPVGKLSPEVRAALAEMVAALRDHREAHDQLKAAIEGLRGACGPAMLACLITWKEPARLIPRDEGLLDPVG